MSEINVYEDFMSNTMILETKFEMDMLKKRATTITGKPLVDALLDKLVEVLSDKWIAENMDEVVHKLDIKKIKNLTQDKIAEKAVELWRKTDA